MRLKLIVAVIVALTILTPVAFAADTSPTAELPDLGSLGSVAIIITSTIGAVEVFKGFPLLKRLPTTALAIMLGLALTVIAYYSGQMSGNLIWLIVQVLLGAVGPSGIWKLGKYIESKSSG